MSENAYQRVEMITGRRDPSAERFTGADVVAALEEAHRGNDRRSVVAVRQRDGRTLTGVFQNEAEAVRFARSKVAVGSKLGADETPHWDQLAGDFDLERVNHSDAYSFLDGIHVDGAESYFARQRRMIRGQHHRVEAGRLDGYPAHAAWLEDNRKHPVSTTGAEIVRLRG